MIKRKLLSEIILSLQHFPVVAIMGQRQVGKTTLAKQLFEHLNRKILYLDLELPSDSIKLKNAELFFKHNTDKLIIIDEVQRDKSLFPILRSMVDKTNSVGQFLILGSASPELIRNSSETLAGRIVYHRLFPFNITEIPDNINQNELWIKGGFPKMILTDNQTINQLWMSSFVDTYLNRDLLQLGLNASPKAIYRLWTMLAHINGQLLNVSTLSKSLALSSPTVKRYIDFLEEAFLVQTLLPYIFNISKRLIKSPKIYLTDTGILHHLLRIRNLEELSGNPIIGSSWETFVINQIISCKPKDVDMFFYRTQHGAELDLVFVKGISIVATAEIKYSNSPNLTKGNMQAINDLQAPVNYVITPSSDDFYFKENIRILSAQKFISVFTKILNLK